MIRRGRFIVVDGIAGSGKSTLLRAVQTWAETCHHRVFRLNEWTDDNPPRFEDVSDYDVYFTYEPTRTWIGRALRYELSRSDNPYGGIEQAHAYALDRQIMYRRLIIPALEAGKTIIQDRSVTTSLVNQPVMPNALDVEQIMALPGNALALRYAPNALILTKISAEDAMARIQARTDDSKGVFGLLENLKKFEQRFASDWLRELFASRGTRVFELNTGGTLEQARLDAQQLIDHILSTC